MTDEQLYLEAMSLPLLQWSRIYDISDEIKDPKLSKQVSDRAKRGYHYEEALCGLL